MDLKHLVGITGIEEKIVESKDSAKVYGSGLVDVFSTPAMIAFAESTCMNTIAQFLTHEFSSVGTHVNMSHEKATPIGDKVVCNCKIDKVEKRRLSFEVSIQDSNGIIGRGTHDRVIINVENFMNKLK